MSPTYMVSAGADKGTPISIDKTFAVRLIFHATLLLLLFQLSSLGNGERGRNSSDLGSRSICVLVFRSWMRIGSFPLLLVSTIRFDGRDGRSEVCRLIENSLLNRNFRWCCSVSPSLGPLSLHSIRLICVHVSHLVFSRLVGFVCSVRC